MKTCLICAHEDYEDSHTCPMCGEASWDYAPYEPPLEEPTTEASVKRGPGRPRKKS